MEIPRGSLTVITGLSGSGKSSLAFDTIFAEGQRRYIETFSAYARNFLGGMERPDVDKITGLSPVISIEQKTTNKILALRWVLLPKYTIIFVCSSPVRELPTHICRVKNGKIYRRADSGSDSSRL